MATMAAGRRGRRLMPVRVLAAVARDSTFTAAGIPVHLIAICVLIAPWANRYVMHLGKNELLAMVVLSAALVLLLRVPLSAAQRHRCWSLLGIEIERPPPAPGETLRQRMAAGLRSEETWRQLAYHLVLGPVLALGGLLTVGAWAAGLGVLVVSSYEFEFSTPRHNGFGKYLVLLFLGGVLLLLVAPLIARLVTYCDVRAATALLGPSRSRELERRVESLSESRAGVVDAADAERRRIERDLHDGAQQRLVSLAMNLGMARENLRDLPDEARKVIEEAHDEAKEALTELRTLVRGLHPVVLEDRGLDAALSGIAARAPLPVRLSVDMGERASPTVEAVAYFVVSECLTNIARHASAARAEIEVTREGDSLQIRVRDDGVGGADPALGTGLASLAQRARSVDGTLRLDSPPGGPTVVTVELPCAL
jgi:signal transduction histidine kinase